MYEWWLAKLQSSHCLRARDFSHCLRARDFGSATTGGATSGRATRGIATAGQNQRQAKKGENKAGVAAVG